EIGHFLGWPLRYEEWRDGERLDGNGAPDWRGLSPQDIFDELRDLEGNKGKVVVEVPHPYTYFDYDNIDPITLEPSDSLLSMINPLLSAVLFSGDFDTMELVNGKSVDYIRRPTIGERRFYSQGLDARIKDLSEGTIDEATYQQKRYILSTEAARRIMYRTPEEQEASLAGRGNYVRCLCGGDGDCAAGFQCDPAN